MTKSRAFISNQTIDEKSFDAGKEERKNSVKAEDENSIDKFVDANDIKLETKVTENTRNEFMESSSKQEGKIKPKDRSRTKSSLSQQGNVLKPSSFSSAGKPQQANTPPDFFSPQSLETVIKNIDKEEIGNDEYYLHVNPVLLYKMWETWEEDEERKLGASFENKVDTPDQTQLSK